jgi:hypothetical protein
MTRTPSCERFSGRETMMPLVMILNLAIMFWVFPSHET